MQVIVPPSVNLFNQATIYVIFTIMSTAASPYPQIFKQMNTGATEMCGIYLGWGTSSNLVCALPSTTKGYFTVLKYTLAGEAGGLYVRQQQGHGDEPALHGRHGLRHQHDQILRGKNSQWRPIDDQITSRKCSCTANVFLVWAHTALNTQSSTKPWVIGPRVFFDDDRKHQDVGQWGLLHTLFARVQCHA